MKKFQVLATALAAAAFLVGCGGNEGGNQSPRVAFTQMVNFGDSLSDVGSYNVGVVALQGGGHYSINGQGATGLLYTNWTEFLAGTLQIAQPCAAETGLDSVAPYVPVPGAPATFHDASTGGTCTSYAQGGARVTVPIGPGNKALLNPADPSTYSNAIGQLTVPVVTQVANYLAHYNGTFTSTQLVTVLAGGNDIFINVATFQAKVAAGVPVAQAAGETVQAMADAGTQLGALVNTQIVAKGATHVVVVNLPDVSLTPYAIANPTAQPLIKQMAVAFNSSLSASLTAGSSVLLVDAFTASEDQATNMAQYGLTNVSDAACGTTNSLVCTKSKLIAAVAPAASAAPATAANSYEYADTVHPTPYGYRLLAELVGEQMAIKGWL
ncbi:MAG: SGNH/GDSL hydrolase family protein [Betaproteobacteria bacterium]